MNGRIVGLLVLVGAVWAPSLSAQVCSGRTLPGELSLAMDAGTSGSWAGRVSVGDQWENGVGWRLGAVGVAPGSGLELQAVQGEVSYSVEATDRVAVCPGVSVLRTLPRVEDGTLQLFDAFVAAGVRTEPLPGVTVIPFVAPHLVLAEASQLVLSIDIENALSSQTPYELRERVWEWGGGLTAGVGVLIGPITVRGTAGLFAASSVGVQPAGGLGVAWRPGAARGR